MANTARFDDEGNLAYAQFDLGGRCLTVKQGEGQAFLRDEKNGRVKSNQPMKDMASALEEAGKRCGLSAQQLLEMAAEASEITPVKAPIVTGRVRKLSASTKEEIPLRREKAEKKAPAKKAAKVPKGK